MPSTPISLTAELQGQIVAGIQSGGYPHVAAEAFGVPKEQFDDWMQRGSSANPRQPYLAFAIAVRQAVGRARLRAETEIFNDDAKVWLIHGPGREAAENPGWSVSVKPAEAALAEHNALLDPKLMAFLQLLTRLLDSYPNARQEVARALMETKTPQDSRIAKTAPEEAAETGERPSLG